MPVLDLDQIVADHAEFVTATLDGFSGESFDRLLDALTGAVPDLVAEVHGLRAHAAELEAELALFKRLPRGWPLTDRQLEQVAGFIAARLRDTGPIPPTYMLAHDLADVIAPVSSVVTA